MHSSRGCIRILRNLIFENTVGASYLNGCHKRYLRLRAQNSNHWQYRVMHMRSTECLLHIFPLSQQQNTHFRINTDDMHWYVENSSFGKAKAHKSLVELDDTFRKSRMAVCCQHQSHSFLLEWSPMPFLTRIEVVASCKCIKSIQLSLFNRVAWAITPKEWFPLGELIDVQFFLIWNSYLRSLSEQANTHEKISLFLAIHRTEPLCIQHQYIKRVNMKGFTRIWCRAESSRVQNLSNISTKGHTFSETYYSCKYYGYFETIRFFYGWNHQFTTHSHMKPAQNNNENFQPVPMICKSVTNSCKKLTRTHNAGDDTN